MLCLPTCKPPHYCHVSSQDNRCLQNVVSTFHVIGQERQWCQSHNLPDPFPLLSKQKPLVAVGADGPLAGEKAQADYYREFPLPMPAFPFLRPFSCDPPTHTHRRHRRPRRHQLHAPTIHRAPRNLVSPVLPAATKSTLQRSHHGVRSFNNSSNPTILKSSLPRLDIALGQRDSQSPLLQPSRHHRPHSPRPANKFRPRRRPRSAHISTC